ncbi:hypothetical protein WL74_18560 [Burkholderia cepacia]|nr:hypothetical protein APZ15_28720 [Burkholderia cepacia ATCC 25416]KVF14542.1 hypothetical protein WJ06_02635 [Burkholderia cepacia]VWB86616.1 hypothetical protein BLA6860_04109 [Burkholderia lata]KVH33143.1 hypothetical protein WS88_23385 [Burkholderia cepacia]KVL06211.1 hypothetical protein WS93_03540 [Burkholderia cepacia]
MALTPPDSAFAFSFVLLFPPYEPAAPIPPPAANAPPFVPEPLAVEVVLWKADAVPAEPAGVTVLPAFAPAVEVELLV